ncbi:3-ketodihydrosphingosine reductase [Nasonia vitripennis]|uniref:3-dehydrosphinganine reductase n=1 Tax=Nasonia vitripennis TaxID=7425 RepID=A0A7M7Q502_NASVI|nr:3-ketodihydrosphingosine reductase [Nasonia vitripennis]
MFWVGFNCVFWFLGNALYGLLAFSLLLLCILSVVFFYEAIRSIVKKNLNKESLQNGALHNKHVVITGGSSGIGKAFAILAAREGANVTIASRTREKLQLARDEIIEARRSKDQWVDHLVLDVSSSSFERIQRAFDQLERQRGPCDLLVNCAGTAACSKIEDTEEDILKYLIDLNFIGSYNCTKAVVPSMKRRKEGKIVLVSSQAGLLGIFGFSAYSATKFALRGLAESLAMELTPYNVSVTLSLPPDTDTPGFAEEEKSKPLETKLISESAALVQPEEVAEKLLKDTLDGKFFSIIGFESFILTTLCSGMSPYGSLSELLLQSVLMGPLRMISAFYLYSFEKIVKRCMKERESHKKSE